MKTYDFKKFKNYEKEKLNIEHYLRSIINDAINTFNESAVIVSIDTMDDGEIVEREYHVYTDLLTANSTINGVAHKKNQEANVYYVDFDKMAYLLIFNKFVDDKFYMRPDQKIYGIEATISSIAENAFEYGSKVFFHPRKYKGSF